MNDREMQNRKIREIWSEIARRNSGAVAEACPDADILSAYSAEMLSEAETARWEKHFSVCAACQETLIALAESEESDAQVSHAITPAIPLAAPDSAPISTDPSHLAISKAPPQLTVMKPRRAAWHWLAPGIAAAVVLAVWLGFREPRPSPGAQVEVTQNAPAIPPQESADQGKQKKENSSRAFEPFVDKASGNEPQSFEAKPPSSPQVIAPNNSSPKSPKSSQSLSSSELPLAAGASAKSHASTARSTEKPRTDLEAGAATAMARPRVTFTAKNKKQQVPGGVGHSNEHSQETKSFDPNQRAQLNRQAMIPRQGSSGAELQASAAQLQQNKSDTSDQPKQTETVAKRAPVRANTPMVRILPSSTASSTVVLAKQPARTKVFAPNPATFWIVGATGLIQHSTNDGLSVIAQNSGVLADLLSGSAPAETVCWVVGRAGTILVTTNGEHWSKVGSPGDQDWVGVRATDALHAMIWDKHQRTYSTQDGGITWTNVIP